MWDHFDVHAHAHAHTHVPVPVSVSNLVSDTIEPKDNKEETECKSCGGSINIMEDGFPTCLTCGLMCKHIIDYSPEWRFFQSNERNTSDPTRCGNPINPLLKESSFGCTILCNYSSSYEMRRIRKWTEWQSTPHKEKTLYDEFQFISIIAQNAGIPKSLIDYAMMVHKELINQMMFRGINRDGIKAASLYISCRHNGYQRSPHEIASIFNLNKHNVTNGCSKGMRIWNNIERSVHFPEKINLHIMTPRLFIDRYCTRLLQDDELIILVKFIADKIENDESISENTPQSSAAGIIFFVSHLCNVNITKLHIKEICNVSEVTINKCYNKFYLLRHVLLPKSIIDKYNII
jgi:transcription initiation factor TFIIB